MSYVYDHELNIYSLPSGTPLQRKLQHVSRHLYAEREVYHARFWESVQAGSQIDLMVCVPDGRAIRAVVWNCYGAAHLIADDCTVLDVPKVQIDIFYQDLADSLAEDVKGVLRTLYLPYEVQEDSYDDEYALRRCIILLEVY